MEQTPCISVIVPVYKVEAYLARCVDSLLGQTYENLEVILVDDGSPDNCGAICEEYAARDPRVKVIHKENGGLSSARNAGIDAARGDYLAFVDSDDWVAPDTYESMLSAMEEYGVKLVCAGRYDVESETGEKTVGLCPPKTEKISGEELVRRIFLWENVDSAACDKLYHRSLFRQIRYPHGRIVEDVPTTYRIALDAAEAVMLSKPVYHYFHRENSITTAKISEKTFHFSEHAAQVYADIRQNHPALEPYARNLKISSLHYNLICLNLAEADSRKQFSREYSRSRKELAAQLGFILKSPWYGGQYKLTALLMVLGLYRPLRAIYQLVKPHIT